MSLYDAVKEIEKEEKKLAGSAGEETIEEVNDTAETEEATEDKPKKEETTEAATGDDEKVEEAAATEEKPDASTYARMRKEASDSKKRADALAEENARLKNPAPTVQKKPEAAADPEPDRSLDPEAHLQWKIRRQDERMEKFDKYLQTEQARKERESVTDSAMDEFVRHEDTFKAATPDYEAVTKFGLQKLTDRVIQQNPTLHGKELVEEIKKRVLTLAAQGQQLGFDPAEHLYLTSKNWGYQPPEQPKAEAEPKKPDFKKIVDHKKKSASSLTPSGKSGKTAISKEAFGDKSFGFSDFVGLSPQDLRELESM